MQESIKSKSDEVCVVKEVWKFMLSRDSASQRELTEKISTITGKSQTASFYIIQLLAKPIQTGQRMENGEPRVSFVQEPLLVEVPSLDAKKHYSLTTHWRDYINSGSDVFERTKSFY